MKKSDRTNLLTVTLLTLFAVVPLTACQSRPVLKQIANDAPEKPINTPEAADQLKKKYEK
ncbi:hypothetical protein [Herbaspirillum seropedicae]|uniref:hypothetical protein n=1 Tax=Herbaspirillum seropedicae TaxID=964 RepID=UPI003D982682